MERKVLVLMNGRSFSNIHAEAVTGFPGRELLVVCLENDKLQLPSVGESVTAAEICEIIRHNMCVARRHYSVSEDWVIVANGGTTAQLAPVLIGTRYFQGRLRVVDMQRDGTVILCDEFRDVSDKPANCMTEQEMFSEYNNTAW